MRLSAAVRATIRTNQRAGDSIAAARRARQSPVVASYTVEVPMRTRNPLNRREHWRAVSKRAREQRERIRNVLSDALLPVLPVTITLVRIAPQPCDVGCGVNASLKAVRDGVADAYGRDDGENCFDWVYEQEKWPTYGVRVTIRQTGKDGG